MIIKYGNLSEFLKFILEKNIIFYLFDSFHSIFINCTKMEHDSFDKHVSLTNKKGTSGDNVRKDIQCS